MEERTGVVTFLGKPLTLIGKELREGDSVPEFRVLSSDLTEVSGRDLAGRIVVYNVVPSLDTEVCIVQTKRFNQELAALPSPIQVITVSADLPFAQSRFAQQEKISHRILSDHRDLSFGLAFGVGIKELRLLARSIFVAGADGRILYREIVSDLSEHPDYESALRAARAAATD